MYVIQRTDTKEVFNGFKGVVAFKVRCDWRDTDSQWLQVCIFRSMGDALGTLSSIDVPCEVVTIDQILKGDI